MLALDVSHLPIKQTAAAVGLDEAILRHLVASGVVEGSDGQCDYEQAAAVAARLAAARAPVEGQGILATDAAVKYRFDPTTLYRWQAEGWISPLIDRRRNRIFNEGDIAFARELADVAGHLAGRSVFPSRPRSGRPRKRPPGSSNN